MVWARSALLGRIALGAVLLWVLRPAASREPEYFRDHPCGDLSSATGEELIACNLLCHVPSAPKAMKRCYITPHDKIGKFVGAVLPRADRAMRGGWIRRRALTERAGRHGAAADRFPPFPPLAGGGLGAQMRSLAVYIEAAIESGCAYLHRPFSFIGHKSNTADVERYFNIGQDCLTEETLPTRGVDVDDLRVVNLSPKEVRAGAKGRPFPPACALGEGVLCLFSRVAGAGNLASDEAEAVAYRILRARYYQFAAEDPNKEITWYPQGEGAEGGVNAVLHVRRGDVQAGASSERFTPNEEIAEVLRVFCRATGRAFRRLKWPKAPRLTIHLASTPPVDFPIHEWNGIVATQCPVGTAPIVMHLGGSALSVFTHFVAADIILYGISSYPKLAADIYQEGVARQYAKLVKSNREYRPKITAAALFDEAYEEELLDHLHRRGAGAG